MQPDKVKEPVKYWSHKRDISAERLRPFMERAKSIYDLFEGKPTSQKNSGSTNMIWSNYKLEKPYCYSSTPKVVAQLRHGIKDPVGLLGSKILRESTQYQLNERRDFHESVSKDVENYLVAGGLGVTRLKYVPTETQITYKIPVFQAPEGVFTGDGQPVDPQNVRQDASGALFIEQIAPDLAFEDVEFEHVGFQCFKFDPQSDWKRVAWVCFDHYWSFEEVAAKFGADLAASLPYDLRTYYRDYRSSVTEDQKLPEKTQIFEFWDKVERKVTWISPHMPGGPILVQDDPLNLRDFFPCPQPLFNNCSSLELMGRPDYLFYEGYVNELEEIRQKRFQLLGFLAIKGLGDKAHKDKLDELLRSKYNHIAYVDMPNFIAEGGINAALNLLDMSAVMEIITALSNQEQVITQNIYEITGISDILRGSVNPYENAEASKAKGSYADLRLGEKKAAVARYCADLVQLTAELVVEKFQPETLKLLAHADSLSEEEFANLDPAIELLKNDGLRRVKIEIETDSTIAIDRQNKKDEFNQYLNSVQALLANVLPLMQQQPSFAPYVVELLIRGCRMFSLGQNVESSLAQALTQAISSATEAAQQPKQPTPDERLVEAQIEKTMAEAQAALGHVQVAAEKVVNSRNMGETLRDSAAAKTALAAEKLRQDWDSKTLDTLK